MNKTIMQLLMFLLILLLVFPYQSPNFYSFQDYTNDSNVVSQLVVKNKDNLMEQIKQKSDAYEVPPVNAKIDKVWKKMPGRNGLKVNIEKSYERMKEKGVFDETLLVYDQVEPETSLDDLPPSPIYKGHPDKNMVSFLINVAWGTENIPSMLNTLKKHQVKATFFIEGKWASNNTKLVKMIKEEGHVIGNHAYDHPDMNSLTEEKNREQIQKTNEILEAITGETPKWFAPPSGSFNNQVVEIASKLDMYTVLWSVDTIDWKKPTTSVMINRVMSNIHPGATILMHPTNSVEQGLDELVLNIQQKGYKIGTVERLLSEKR
ncbi:polysaccharide deacetylase family protein [Aquibacillus koreensis]|uniref:Polysaccharide deacetylase family protein n=1 Tax=Aquibacillus koreensis TaxID=279446 RepID=A0A9X3WR57_9BACI|nr:polysaccharide deacetylase family protein [Aquibacillus koreensis]MCT2534572.1 polysaccharide deacetylase family protein [Aquibacillus koreensis]MDC3421834.1 polysaccharide deacetylase family protein [Aquibacillus koreensis]